MLDRQPAPRQLTLEQACGVPVDLRVVRSRDNGAVSRRLVTALALVSTCEAVVHAHVHVVSHNYSVLLVRSSQQALAGLRVVLILEGELL